MANPEIVMRPRAALKPYANNARTHSPEQVEQIAGAIRRFGWTNPALIDERDNLIAGHGRVMAAALLGVEEIPCIVVAGLSEGERRALILADNRIAENAGWNPDLLKMELTALRGLDFNLQELGFSITALNEFGVGPGAGEPEQKNHGALAARFGIVPFSVLSARDGIWQDRKRAWLALGIESELGRGEMRPGMNGGFAAIDVHAAAPGGRAMPAANYAKTKARGNGKGEAV